MASYLVTGGAGFIGSALVRSLLETGDRVRVLDNFSTGKRANLEGLEDRIEILEGDVTDAERVSRAVEGIDYVLHQAAIPSVPRSVSAPLESHTANATGTLTVLEAARRNGVRRLVYASSSSVYGASEELPKREAMKPDPLSPYAVSKLSGEQYCLVYYRLHGLETVALRYFNVFGPRQDPTSPYSGVVSRFIDALLAGTTPVIYGDGKQSRDFTYVENVARANLAACLSPRAAGNVYNVGCEQRTSVEELWKIMAGLAGVDPRARFEAARPGDVLHSQADISLSRADLDYEPEVALADGLRRTLAFYGALGEQTA